MNHRPFEEWIVGEENLDPAQRKSLRMHLDDCSACTDLASKWNQVSLIMRYTDAPLPRPGFTQRWERNLEEFEYRRKSWRGWLVLGAAAVLAVTSVLLPGLLGLLSLGEVLDWFSEAYASLLAIFSGMQTVLDAFYSFFPNITPAILVSLLNLGAISIIIIWLVALKQLAYTKEYLK